MNINLRYQVLCDLKYDSKRYGKGVLIKKDFCSDGATGAIDIEGPVEVYDKEEDRIIKVSLGWIVHDKLCNTGQWADGTKCTNLQASTVLSDILASEGRYMRRIGWWLMTFAFGGGKARDNGMFKVKE